MGSINILSKEVSELIAAGEVIDRPSSVIKELLENAIDSHADLITVEIKNGGRTYMRVTDNGCGIAAEDVPKAFLRHATSKVRDSSDLDGIKTLGFRGEALASICAVSKVDLLTGVHSRLGVHYRICGGVEEINEEAGCPSGTTVIVRDIFYNVPARLKFLKKDVTEGNAIAAIVSKLALSNPRISVKFIRDNKTELLTAGDTRKLSAVYSCYGREFASTLIEVGYSYEGILVEGFVSKPLLAKANHSFQNFFINGRYVKSLTCMHAVDEAYLNSIMAGKVAACILYLTLPPEIVDVNVHPTKLEVRFSNEKLVYDAVYFAVKTALMNNGGDNTLSLDKSAKTRSKGFYGDAFEFRPLGNSEVFCDKSDRGDASRETVLTGETETADKEYKPEEKSVYSFSGAGADPSDCRDPMETGDVIALTDYRPKNARLENRAVTRSPFMGGIDGREASHVSQKTVLSEEDASKYKYINNSSFTDKPASSQTAVFEQEEADSIPLKVLGEAFKTYIIAQQGDELFLIDKHAAHERFIFNRIKEDSGVLEAQLLLEPVMVQLSFEEYDALCENIEKTSDIGFVIEPDVAPTVAVKGIPLLISQDARISPEDVVAQIARNFIDCRVDPQLELISELYHSLACKAAVKANDPSAFCELEVIAKTVIGDDALRYCPHGRPVVIKLSRQDIEKQFRRIV